MEFTIINQTTGANPIYTSGVIAQFLFTHLEEYGDKIADILKCIDYVMHPDKGGNIVIGIDENEIGKQLMEKAISIAEGNIALHVEPDNPAKKLYEKLGFTNKYLEMRLIK